MTSRPLSHAAFAVAGVAASSSVAAAQSPSVSGADTSYAVVVFGVLAVLGFLTFVVRRSPFAWVATGFSMAFVCLWAVGVSSARFMFLVFALNGLVLAIAGAVTKGRG